MVLPLTNPSDDRLIAEALIRAELNALTKETVDMNTYRDYFEGEQTLTYTTDTFDAVFGEAFKGFRDNWCEVVINATNDKLTLTGFDLSTGNADTIWEVFGNNDIDEQQIDHHEGTLVEGRSFVIVWPDEEMGATIDWQPGQLCRVFYNPDQRREALWAVKRWQTDFGEIYVTFYTPENVMKFLDTAGSATALNSRMESQSSASALTEIPGVGFAAGLERREVEGEPWPLPNPLDEVPVVEFNNTSYRSEIKHVLPQQDAINKMIADMLVASSFSSFPQKYVETLGEEPADGWDSGPGEVWHFTPSMSATGDIVQSKFGSFDTTDPSNYIEPISMMLQHVALTTSTPVRYFNQVDRGGRGDAPSGESLLVDDKPLNDKVEKKQIRFGNRWIQVARLVSKSLSAEADIRGEATWIDPRYDYRLSVVEEAKGLVEMGVPLKFVVTKLGLTSEEQDIVVELIEEEMEAETEASLATQSQPNETE